MSDTGDSNSGLSRRKFLEAGTAALGGSILGRFPGGLVPRTQVRASTLDVGRAESHIYHARNGTPAQNVAKVFETAYGGIENFIGQDDIVLLRPNLQWGRNGYTNTEIGMGMIDLVLNRPGGFTGEIIVIENQHRSDPHTSWNSGWSTTNKLSNGPYNWFELVEHYVQNTDSYPNGIHGDPATGQINVSFQFLLKGDYGFALEDPHPILTTYGGKAYAGTHEWLDGDSDPFQRFKYEYPTSTCFYVRTSDIRYTNAIARVSSLNLEYEMSYPIFKSQHSGLYISLYKEHPTAWDPSTEDFVPQRVKLINMSTLNHHGMYAGVTSVVKGHFGMVIGTFHYTGRPGDAPSTFYYAGGAVGYWMANIRQADLHMSCAERIGLVSREEPDAYHAKSVAISTDPVALDYFVGKNILFPAGGVYGLGGAEAGEPWSNDPSMAGGYYGLTLEFCRDPLADHSIINGTLDENEMEVHLHDFDRSPCDFDGDGSVDLTDYQHFHGCTNGPGGLPAQTDCGDADFDSDSDVDMSDFDSFLDFFGESG